MSSACMNTRSLLGEAYSLWTKYEYGQNPANRNELFSFYEPWVKKITSSLYTKFGGQTLEWNDFFTLASWGCLEAVEKFDTNYGIPFEAFAYKYLKGKVLDGLKNSHDGNSIHQKSLKEERVSSLTAEQDDDPFEFILDAVVGLALGQFLELGIIDETLNNQVVHPYTTSVENIEFEFIKALIEKLDDEHKFIIKYHYFQRFKFYEIAELLNVSKARVSQQHRRAILKIREMYEQHST